MEAHFYSDSVILMEEFSFRSAEEIEVRMVARKVD